MSVFVTKKNNSGFERNKGAMGRVAGRIGKGGNVMYFN